MPRLRCGCCRRRCYISFNTRDWLYCRVIKLYVGYDLRPSFLHSRRGPRARHHDIFAGRKKKKKKKKKKKRVFQLTSKIRGRSRTDCYRPFTPFSPQLPFLRTKRS